MAQKKLIRFKEINSFPNVLQYPENMQGKWKLFFKNNNPVILELACGKGEYTVGLAKIYPDKNYIGVDIKGNRLWAGAKRCLDENILNAAFLRTQIDKINNYFETGEVHEIWITFPDPQLRKSKAKKRLTHPGFLKLYKNILQPGGYLHLKTDSPDLYQFTKLVIDHYELNLVSDIKDLYKVENLHPQLRIQTHYESLDIAKSNTVFYLCFTLPEVLADNDDRFADFLKSEELINAYDAGIN
ncbi:MAG: tRNA (guanosine(46)-N7)-methyltransferase TrmB [Chitinophagaceae bacterium]|nr:tRNA (guanosine(46)-N7)-methyltransferase TrmB [Chitinophagaceae bacterium]